MADVALLPRIHFAVAADRIETILIASAKIRTGAGKHSALDFFAERMILQAAPKLHSAFRLAGTGNDDASRAQTNGMGKIVTGRLR